MRSGGKTRLARRPKIVAMPLYRKLNDKQLEQMRKLVLSTCRVEKVGSTSERRNLSNLI